MGKCKIWKFKTLGEFGNNGYLQFKMLSWNKMNYFIAINKLLKYYTLLGLGFICIYITEVCIYTTENVLKNSKDRRYNNILSW